MIFRFLLLVSAASALSGVAACSSDDVSVRPVRDAGPDADPQVGQPWVIDGDGGFCFNVDALVEDPVTPGRLWFTAGEIMSATLSRDATTDRFAFDLRKPTTGVVSLQSIKGDVFLSLAGSAGSAPRTVVYAGADTPTEVFPWAARRLARSDSGCVGGEHFVSNEVGTELVVRGADGTKQRTLALPHYVHWPLFLDAMVGLEDSLLVLADRNAEGRGALYRVSCASLDFQLIASGDGVSLLNGFTRGKGTRLWAIDGGWETRRLAQSDDEGTSWKAVSGLLDFVASRIFVRDEVVVVAGAHMDVIAVSTDAGATWHTETIQSFSKSVPSRATSSAARTCR